MSAENFTFACALFADRQRMIAAGKLQRWDVVKWTVTVNVALAAAVAFKANEAGAGLALTVLAAIVAAIGLVLMFYYNWRLTKTRSECLVTEQYLERHLAASGIEYKAISGADPKCVDWGYDEQELAVFTVILVMSIVPTGIVWALVQH